MSCVLICPLEADEESRAKSSNMCRSWDAVPLRRRLRQRRWENLRKVVRNDTGIAIRLTKKILMHPNLLNVIRVVQVGCLWIRAIVKFEEFQFRERKSLHSIENRRPSVDRAYQLYCACDSMNCQGKQLTWHPWLRKSWNRRPLGCTYGGIWNRWNADALQSWDGSHLLSWDDKDQCLFRKNLPLTLALSGL